MLNAEVILVLRSCAEHYPPTLNQANLLAEAGLPVGVVDLFADGNPDALHSSIRRWRAHRAWNSKIEHPHPRWKRWINWLRFYRICRSVIRSETPRVVIAYDTLGIVFVPPFPRRYRTIYHFHELTGPDSDVSFGPRRARLQAMQRSRHADLVVFPDAHRARIYKERAGLPIMPKIVMNCPRRLEQIPISPLRDHLSAFSFQNFNFPPRAPLSSQVSVPPSQPSTLNPQPIVLYLGSIGADQGLVEAAASMKHWPETALFVLIGPASDAMKRSITDAAGKAGAANRVLFLGAFPHEEALALAAGADLGVSLIQPNNESWTYSAGAINKRFEFMALGLPQVTTNGPGVSEIVEKSQAGLCVDPRNPNAIGAAIRRLLEDASMRRSLRQNARRMHLERFNYETQFAEVATWIKAQCSMAR